MIPIGVWLLVTGVGAAMLRAHVSEPSGVPVTKPSPSEESALAPQAVKDNTFDDVTELQHYRRVSAYGFALTLSGYWFFPPASIIGLPLHGYSVWNYIRTLKHTKPEDRASASSLFEGIGVIGSTLTGHAVISSTILVSGFGMRNLMLHIGNIAHNHAPGNLKLLQQKEVWVLRDDAELLLPVSSLRSSDRIVINTGDVIPLSGKVVEGKGQVIQFSLEKRMKLIQKRANNLVHPHTKLQSGNLLVKPNLPKVILPNPN